MSPVARTCMVHLYTCQCCRDDQALLNAVGNALTRHANDQVQGQIAFQMSDTYIQKAVQAHAAFQPLN